MASDLLHADDTPIRVLDRIQNHKINRLDELLPWNWVPQASVPSSQAA